MVEVRRSFVQTPFADIPGAYLVDMRAVFEGGAQDDARSIPKFKPSRRVRPEPGEESPPKRTPRPRVVADIRRNDSRSPVRRDDAGDEREASARRLPMIPRCDCSTCRKGDALPVRLQGWPGAYQTMLFPPGPVFDRIWFWRATLPDRKGQQCRILARGTMNSCLVEFRDGVRHIVSRYGVRKNKSI